MCLSSGNVKDDLEFNQCEADTIILSLYTALRSSGYSDPVVIDTQDTDLYIQEAAVSHDIPGQRYLFQEKEAAAFMQMHVR